MERQFVMNTLQFKLCVLALMANVLCAPLHAETWRSVPDQSQLAFIANYEGAEAFGQFKRFDVLVSFDRASLTFRSLLVDVEISSANMDNPEIDETIGQTEWFNIKAFPRAQFRSDQVRSVKGSEYVAKGIVSIKGVNKSVSIPFRWRSYGQDAKMTGAVILSRVDFGIGSGEWAADSPIGHAVKVRFDITLKAQR